VFEFEDLQEPSTEQQEELFKELTEAALNGQHHEWEYIKNITEYGIVKAGQAGLLKVIELFETCAKSVYSNYCAQVAEGTGEFPLLYAYTQYLECKKFYEYELDLTEDMLAEYWAYVWSGHFMDQWLFGRDRESWHLWDHRQEGPNGK
jgi:hypothetical protein